MLDRIRNRISLENIELCLEGKQLIFKCALTDEKQLNLAAGKIHRGKINDDAAVTRTWHLEESILILKITPNKTAFKLSEISDAFKRMVS